MKKKWWIIALGLLAFIAAVVVVVRLPPKEPAYKGKPLSFWVKRACSGDDSPMCEAAYAGSALCKIDPRMGPVVTPILERAFHEDDIFTRIVAVRAHWRINSQPAAVVPVLTGLMDQPGNRWPVDTLIAFAEIGPAAKAALPFVTKELDSGEPVVRQAAARALATIDAEAAAKAGVK